MIVDVKINISSPTAIKTSVKIPQIIEGVSYDGSYEIIPTIEEQQMITKNKTRKKEITIKPIPYYETSNLSNGTTVIIGGKLNE